MQRAEQSCDDVAGVEYESDNDGTRGGNSNGGKSSNNSSSVLDQASSADLLGYISDLVEELQALTARTNCSTLSGILDLARKEALVQKRALQRTDGRR